MTPRTTLPPNLTRHFYETRRAFLRAAGQDPTPWYRLTRAERTVVESEMTLFREAIRRAEAEQDLLASLDARLAPAVDEPATTGAEEPVAADDATEDCPRPSRAAVAALLNPSDAPGEPLDVALDPDSGREKAAEGEIASLLESAVADLFDGIVPNGPLTFSCPSIKLDALLREQPPPPHCCRAFGARHPLAADEV
ncbi:hypothetical protein [Streptomyces sp. NPDC047315]|uniref:hypothetical protein n=1 Tax=Streptomyces sp. NPDC047315 TaxID=3155142 RepID=UPI0033C0644D